MDSKSLIEVDRLEGDEIVERKFSKFSVVLIIIGIFVAYMGFLPINILGWWGIFIGFGIYLTGIVLGICAFFKKEKGFMKYISLLSILSSILFIAFLYGIIGAI